MITVSGRTTAGAELVLIGLRPADVDRLRAGESITVETTDLTERDVAPVTIALIAGDTDADLATRVAGFDVVPATTTASIDLTGGFTGYATVDLRGAGDDATRTAASSGDSSGL